MLAAKHAVAPSRLRCGATDLAVPGVIVLVYLPSGSRNTVLGSGLAGTVLHGVDTATVAKRAPAVLDPQPGDGPSWF